MGTGTEGRIEDLSARSAVEGHLLAARRGGRPRVPRGEKPLVLRLRVHTDPAADAAAQEKWVGFLHATLLRASSAESSPARGSPVDL